MSTEDAIKEAVLLLKANWEIGFDGQEPYLLKGQRRQNLSLGLFNTLLKNNVIGLRGGSGTIFVISDWYKHVGQFGKIGISSAS